MPSSKQTDLPVAIVGSGPVGMMLALYLARMGVNSILIEQDDTTLWHPKGNTHNARTMEHYRKLGLADEIRLLGLPIDHPTDVTYMTQLRGKSIHRLEMPSTSEKLAARNRKEPLSQIPEPLQRVNQMYVERVVSAHLLAEPRIDARYGSKLEAFEQNAQGVTVHVRNVTSGHPELLHVAYLVGCDGPRSIVREALGYGYIGDDSFSKSFMGGPMLSTYVRLRARDGRPLKPHASWQFWLLRPDTILNMVSLNGDADFILTAAQIDASDEESVRAAARDAVGTDVDVEVISAREWTAGRALVAEHYGSNRVFLCGDSIHLFTPTGGFGMNTGVDDAVNLAWKLAGAVQGWGGVHLLETYETERRPVGVRNSGAARVHAGNIRDIQLSDVLGDDTPAGEAARVACVPILQSLAEEFASIGIQLGARYEQSPLVVDTGEAPPADDPFVYTPSSIPGGRAPHLWLPDGSSLFDHTKFRFTLLRFEQTADVGNIAAAALERGLPFAIFDIAMVEARTLYPEPLALVRPDDHIAWRGSTISDADALLDKVLGC